MNQRGVIYLLRAYAKSAQANLSAADRASLQKLVAELKTI